MGHYVTGITHVVDGFPFLWDHVSVPSHVILDQVPYLSLDSVTSVSGADLELGDFLSLKLEHPDTLEEVEVFVSVISVYGQAIFVEWDPLFRAIGLAQQVALGRVERVMGYEALPSMRIRVVGLHKSYKAPPLTDMVEVPTLSTDTLEGAYQSGRDHTVSDSRVEVKHLIHGTVDCAADSGTVTFRQNETRHIDAEGADLETLTGLGGYLLILKDGDGGVYPITSISGNTLIVSREIRIRATTEAWVCRYGASSPSPKTLWAELAYFDNWETVQNNYGILVGLPKDTLDAVNDGNADYLDVVRAMSFAFVGGPTLANMQTAVQSMFGLANADADGIIVNITIGESGADDTRITYIGDDEIIQTYTFPYNAVLATNRRTGTEIEAVDPDLISGLIFTDYNRSLEIWRQQRRDAGWTEDTILDTNFDRLWATWQSAALLRYEPFVDVVNVDDYVSDPELVASVLPGQEILRKYHTFVVRVPLNVTNSTAIFSVIRDFLLSAKPAHTNFILFGTVPFSDEINVSDDLTLKVTIKPVDTLHTSPFHTLHTLDPLVAAAGHDLTLMYPDEETLSKPAGVAGAWNAADVVEKYESGYACGKLDDYSGDGSVNKRQEVVHQVNQLDSDIDVCMSRHWVPFEKVVTGGQDLIEFVVGEEIELYSGGVLLASTWDASPPVVAHIGAGQHPKLGFGVYLPQTEHPFTYVILAFDNQNYTTASNYGHTDRLYEIFTNRAEATLQIRGKTSGALGDLTEFADPATVAGDRYYHTERIFRSDRYTDFNPEVRFKLSATAYIPAGGMFINTFESLTSYFASSAFNVEKEVQQFPYDGALADNVQFIPSFGPGFFTGFSLAGLFDDATGGVNATGANYNIRWGYTDVGKQNAVGAVLGTFTPDVSTEFLENVHVGVHTRERKSGYSEPHGIVNLQLLDPKLILATHDGGGPGNVRLEGNYFVDDDPNRTVIAPFATPTAWDGTHSGCWVYFRNQTSGVVTPAASFSFETGTGVRTVLGLDGTVQPSDGHVLTAPVPALVAGTYDVIIRNFRPYLLKAAGAPQLYTVDTEALSVFVI